MFREPFNFSLQRTPLQAVGWYLVLSAIVLLIGGILGGMSAAYSSATDFHGGVLAGFRVAKYFAPIYPAIIGGLVLWSRQFTATNVILTLLAVLIGVIFGWMVAGVLLAYQTTRLPRHVASSIPATFD